MKTPNPEICVKSILDPSFAYTPSINTDIRRTFERVWRELGEREPSRGTSRIDRDSLWLDCNGDLVDSGAVKVLGIRQSAPGVEMVQFLCPRCHEQHESLRFR